MSVTDEQVSTDPVVVGGDEDNGAGQSPATAEVSDAPSEASEPKTAQEAAAQALARERGEALKPEEASEADAEPESDNDSAESNDEAKVEDVDKGGEGAAKDEDRLSDEEIKALGPRVRRRISTLTRERHEAREKAEAAEASYAEIQPRAQAFDEFQALMVEHHIDGDLLANTMTATSAFVNNRPEEFIRLVEPLLEECRRMLGQSVDPELSSQIDAGELTEDAAKRITRERAEAARIRDERDRLVRGQEEAQTNAGVEAHRMSLQNAAADEADKLKAEDPRFAAKEKAIAEEIKAFVAKGGAVPNQQAARVLVRQAHEIVSLREAQAVRPATPANPRSTGSPTTLREPQTAMEAAKMGLAMARRIPA